MIALDGLARPQHRAGGDRLLQHRRIDDLARRAAGPLRQPLAEPADLAGVLDQREPGAHRHRAADRNIGRRRHRKARGGKAEHQVIGILAHRQMLALAHHVPDVAEHEEIAGHGARQARNIVGVAGDETGGKALCKMRGGIFFGDGVADAFRQFVAEGDVPVAREFDKTVGEIGIAGGQRRLDIVRHQRGLFRRAELSLISASCGGLVLRRQDRAGVAGMRP